MVFKLYKAHRTSTLSSVVSALCGRYWLKQPHRYAGALAEESKEPVHSAQFEADWSGAIITAASTIITILCHHRGSVMGTVTKYHRLGVPLIFTVPLLSCKY